MHYETDVAELRKQVEQWTDAMGNPIDEGIKDTVVYCNAVGLRTSQSCEGHFDEGRTPFPWVEIYPEEPDNINWIDDDVLRSHVESESLDLRKQAVDFLSLFYADRDVAYDVMLGFENMGYGFRIQSIGAATLSTLPSEEQHAKVDLYKREMQAFTAFLKQQKSKK